MRDERLHWFSDRTRDLLPIVSLQGRTAAAVGIGGCMSRKSREAVVIEENNEKIAKLEDQIKTLRAVNEALETMKRSKPVIVRARPAQESA